MGCSPVHETDATGSSCVASINRSGLFAKAGVVKSVGLTQPGSGSLDARLSKTHVSCAASHSFSSVLTFIRSCRYTPLCPLTSLCCQTGSTTRKPRQALPSLCRRRPSASATPCSQRTLVAVAVACYYSCRRRLPRSALALYSYVAAAVAPAGVSSLTARILLGGGQTHML